MVQDDRPLPPRRVNQHQSSTACIYIYSLRLGTRTLRTKAPIQTALGLLKRLDILRSCGARGGQNKRRTIRAIGGTYTKKVQPLTLHQRGQNQCHLILF